LFDMRLYGVCIYGNGADKEDGDHHLYDEFMWIDYGMRNSESKKRGRRCWEHLGHTLAQIILKVP